MTRQKVVHKSAYAPSGIYMPDVYAEYKYVCSQKKKGCGSAAYLWKFVTCKKCLKRKGKR